MQGFLNWAREKYNSVYQGVAGTVEAAGAVTNAVLQFITTPDLQRSFASRLSELTLGFWRAVSPFNYLDLVRRPETRAILWQGLRSPLRRLGVAISYYGFVKPAMRRLVTSAMPEFPVVSEVVLAVPEVVSIVYFTNRSLVNGRVDGVCYNLAMAKASSDEVVREAFSDLRPTRPLLPEYRGLSQQQLLAKLMQDPAKFEREFGLSAEHQKLLKNPTLGPCAHDEDTRGSATIPSSTHWIGTAVFVNLLSAAARGYSPQYGEYAAFVVNALFIGRGNMEFALNSQCMEDRLNVMNRNNTYAAGFGSGILALGYGTERLVDRGVKYAIRAVIGAGFSAYGADMNSATIDGWLQDVQLTNHFFIQEPIYAGLDLHGVMVTNLNRGQELPGKGPGIDLFKPVRALTDTVQGQITEWASAGESTIDWNEVLHSKPARAAAWMLIKPSLQVWRHPVIQDGRIVEPDGWDKLAMRPSSRVFLQYYGEGVVIGLKGAREKSRYIPYKAFDRLNKFAPTVAGWFASEEDRGKLAMINRREVKDTIDVWAAWLEKVMSDDFVNANLESHGDARDNGVAGLYAGKGMRERVDSDLTTKLQRQMSVPVKNGAGMFQPPPRPKPQPQPQPKVEVEVLPDEPKQASANKPVLRRRAPHTQSSASLYSGQRRRFQDLNEKEGDLQSQVLGQMRGNNK